MISIEIELQRQIDKLSRRLDDLAARDRPGRLACVVYRNSVQSFTGQAALSWSSILTDTSGGAMWAIANPTRLVAPVSGWYLCLSTYQYVAAQITAGGVEINFYHLVNGTVIYGNPVLITVNATNVRQQGVSLMYLNAGDYVEAIVNQNFGVSKSISLATATNIAGNSGSIVKVG